MDECVVLPFRRYLSPFMAVFFILTGVGFPTIGPSERLSARLDDLGQFLVLRYLTPLWAESKLSRPLIAL